MTNPPTDERRAAFEAWKIQCGCDAESTLMDSYKTAFDRGYQAALSGQGEVVKSRCPYCDDTGDVHSIDGEWRGSCDCCKVVKVSDLRALADTWEGFTKAFDRPDSGYTNEKIVGHRRALTHDLTALISKAEKV